MPDHPEQNSENNNSASARRKGVVAVIIRQERFLVIRRSATVVAPLAYCFPGGGIENIETQSEALIREMQEELNVAVQPIRCLWQNTTSWGTDLAWWYSHLSASQQLQRNPDEVHSVHWLTIPEMLKLPDILESNLDFLAAHRAGKFTLDEFADP